MNPSAVSEGLGLGSPKFLTLFLSIPDRSQRSHFWNFFLKISKNWTSKILGGPRALGEKSKNGKKSIFLQKIVLFLAKSVLYMFSAFFWGTKHFCSSKFEILTFFRPKLVKIVKFSFFNQFLWFFFSFYIRISLGWTRRCFLAIWWFIGQITRWKI